MSVDQSSLRQKGCWDEHYELELKNFDEHGDEGEVWFGERLSNQIVNWISERIDTSIISHHTSIVEVGCGNAFKLCKIAEIRSLKRRDLMIEENRDLTLLGLDYSSNSIQLAKKILDSKGLKDNITLKVCDILDSNQLQSVIGDQRFDFVIDVGTYDAICLMANESLDDTKLKYMYAICSLVKVGSIFVIASCNNTENELMSLFGPRFSHGNCWRLVSRIETPKMVFGGIVGQQVTCLILELEEKREFDSHK